MIVRKLMLLAFFLGILASGKHAAAQPTITGLDATGGAAPTNDPVLTWLLTFDEAVNGVTPANFTLTGTGVTGNIADASPLPGNTNWMITVDTVAGDGTLGLDLSDPAGITGASGALTETYTGEFYTVDNTSPQVTGITRLDPSPTVATTVNFQISFSEQVYNLTTANFAVGRPAGSTVAGTVSSITPTADPLVWTGTISGITGAGYVSLDLNDTSGVSDVAGNWLLSDYTIGERYAIAPQLLCITRLDAIPTSATTLRFRVEFNVPVSGFTPANVEVTGPSGVITDVTVAPEASSAPSTNWIVTVNSVSGDGSISMTLQNPGTIQEPSGVSLFNVTPVNCNENTYPIDQTPPAANCITPFQPSDNTVATSATEVQFQVSFDEPVTGVTASNFSLAWSDMPEPTLGAPVTSDGGATWIIPVTGIAEDVTNQTNGRIELAWANTTGIIDAAGNTAVLPTGCAAAGYDIDQRQPELTCVTREPADVDNPTSLTTVQFRLIFDEPIHVATFGPEDLEVILSPAAGFTSAQITALTPVTAGASSNEFIATVSNITGNSATQPFAYIDENTGREGLGNGLLTIDIAPATPYPSIFDVTGNPVAQPTELSGDCENTSYTIDQVRPRVTTATLEVTDCMSEAVFTVGFSEWISDLSANNIETTWTGGPCSNPTTIFTIERISNTTFTVEVHGYYEIFHQNGPGELTLGIVGSDTLFDLAGNPLAGSFVTEDYFICRCFEPVVGIAPRAITEIRQYDTSPTTDCPADDVCTAIGLQTAHLDTPTTTTTPDSIQWLATEWDCQTTRPFTVYIDEEFTSTTHGGRNTADLNQFPPNTPNNLCYPIGTTFTLPLDRTFTPGLHTYRINLEGACTSGTLMYFNVLDAPEAFWPPDDLHVCVGPRAFEWTPVDGATGYELFLRESSATCFDKIGAVTSPTVHVDLPNQTYAEGEYYWFVRAYNTWGHQDSTVTSFTVVSDPNPIQLSNHNTNGTIHDIHITTETTYIAGDFTLVHDGTVYHDRPYLAAIDNSTGQLRSSSLPRPNNAVHTLEFQEDAIYIGGTFTQIDGQPRARIARLIPSSNTPGDPNLSLDPAFMPGANGTVRAIEVVDDLVYYGGDFTRVGTQVYNFGNINDQIPATRLAVTSIAEGITSSTDLNPNASVYDLLHDQGHLYIGGAFSEIGGTPLRALARATLTTTSLLDSSFNMDIQAGVSHYIYSMEMVGDKLFFGGSFTSVRGENRQNAAAVAVDRTSNTLTRLLPWNPQPHGAVHALERHARSGIVFLGGTFTVARQQHHAYLLGVDPVVGYNLSCELNQQRAVYAIDTPSHDTAMNPVNVEAGGLTPLSP